MRHTEELGEEWGGCGMNMRVEWALGVAVKVGRINVVETNCRKHRGHGSPGIEGMDHRIRQRRRQGMYGYE